jgi:hypothetical protein
MSTKELQTRIALKYDSYSAWTTSPGKDLVLLKGEIGICEVPAATIATTAPTVLYKIGDGKHTFEELRWASALAADVYTWAKAETVKLDGNVIKFETDGNTVHSIDLSSFATDAEVSVITAQLEARITALESSSGSGSGAITNSQYDALDSRLDILEGADSTEGSVKNAAKVAKTYADEKDAEIKSSIEQVKTDINKKVSTLNTNIVALETAISVEEYNREEATTAINEKIGDGFTSDNTVKKAIENASALGQQGINIASAVQSELNELTSTGAIAKNTSNIAQIAAGLESFDAKTDELDGRLKGIEAFFEASDHDGKEGGLRDALDTLVEIQEYLTGDGTAASSLLGRVAEAEADIKSIETRLNTSTASLSAAIEANTSDISVLQELTSSEGDIYKAVNAAQFDATQSITISTEAKSSAESAVGLANQVKNQLSSITTLVSTAQATASTAAAGVEALEARMGTAEETLRDLVSGDNTNVKLRAAITDLQELTNDESTGNIALRNDITTMQDLVTEHSGGISGARAVADSALLAVNIALSRLDAIESDYLTSNDEFILQCGNSTKVTHEV